MLVQSMTQRGLECFNRWKNCWVAISCLGPNCDRVKVLENLSLKIEENEFLAIIGPVGSGKTSFLLSLMGEIPLVSGSLKINSNIAYAPSLDSWLLNASLRENILMGKDFKETWYWTVLFFKIITKYKKPACWRQYRNRWKRNQSKWRTKGKNLFGQGCLFW